MSNEKNHKTINQKIEQLNSKVEWFYGEDFNLDQAATHYKETLKLAKDIEMDLEQLQNQIEVIDKDFTKE